MHSVYELFVMALASERLGEIIGVIGAIVYVGGFYLVQSGRVCGNSIAYPISKVIAALLVLFSLYTALKLAAFLIQVSYALIGIYGVARRFAEPRERVRVMRREVRTMPGLIRRLGAPRSTVSVLC